MNREPELYTDPLFPADDVALSLDYITHCLAELYAVVNDRALAVDIMNSIQRELDDVARILRAADHDTTMPAAVATTMRQAPLFMDVA